MHNCPFGKSCSKYICDMSCSTFAEISHWFSRNSLNTSSAVSRMKFKEFVNGYRILGKVQKPEDEFSDYTNIVVYKSSRSLYYANVIAYLAISLYCQNCGFYNGVYSLDFSKYLEDLKASWNSRSNPVKLDDVKTWCKTSRFLIIYNLGLVKFGDFESQTLLSLLQDRRDLDKYTIIGLDSINFKTLGKPDSHFFMKLCSLICGKEVDLG